MKISVIIPAYNHEKYIAEAITSVLNQSCQDFELIIINDGSTDSTEQRILSIQDRRIQYLSQKNSGAHSAINLGISLARGEYVSILNSDDVYAPDRLEKCLDFLEHHPGYSVVMTTMEGIDDQGTPVRQTLTPQGKNWLDWYRGAFPLFEADKSYPNAFAENIMVTTSNLFARRKVFQECGGFRGLRYAHDWDMLLRLSRRYQIHLLREDLLKYRIHSKNTISEDESHLKTFFEVNWLIVENLKELDENVPFAEILEFLKNNKYLSSETLFFLLMMKDQPAFYKLIDFSNPRTVQMMPFLDKGINPFACRQSIAALEQTVAARDQLIATLEQTVAARDQSIAALEQRSSARDQSIAALQVQIQDLYNSTSWKITKPVRFVRRSLMNKPSQSLFRIISSGARHRGLKLPFSMQGRQEVKNQRFRWTRDSQGRHDPKVKRGYESLSALEERTSENCRKILLVIHEFSRSGTPQAVLYLAQALFTFYGIRPVIMSPIDGPIREEFEKNGFPTIFEPSLSTPCDAAEEVSRFVSGFELVIATSISSYSVIRHYKDVMSRLIWWIHEDAAGLEYIKNDLAPDLASLFDACEAVWIGSPVCSQPVLQYVAPEKIHLLLYGCEDTALPHRPHEAGRMVFTLVGSIEPRKGQDIFLAAVELLPADLRRKAVFRIIGSPWSEWSVSDNLHREILARASVIPEVECLPNMPFDQLLDYYSETDVLVSTSRADPMPIAVTLGLMFAKTCLCASSIGHVKLLKDGENALIFQNESVPELVEKMTWILENPDAVTALGASGRKVYENHFHMTTFARNVGNLIRGLNLRESL